jgi:Fe-S-cluster-containing dehydrogenase component
MIACSLAKSGAVRMGASRIDIRSSWPKAPEIRVCRFEDCDGHPCIASCPVKAISELDGVVLIDSGACIGCGACEASCPYQAITIENGTALKCDLCGGDPACVKECVTGAIRNREVAD